MNARNMDWNIEKRCITWLLFVLNGLHVFYVYFKMRVMSKRHTRIFFYFCIRNALSLVYIGYESGGNNLKATGDVATFI